jgi:hypothetical protein
VDTPKLFAESKLPSVHGVHPIPKERPERAYLAFPWAELGKGPAREVIVCFTNISLQKASQSIQLCSITNYEP